MFKILSLIALLFHLSYNVEGLCNYFQNYYLLGQLTNTDIQQHTCKNDADTCEYLSFDFPGLAIGSFSGCPEETNYVLTIIIGQRSDVYNEFKGIMNNKTGFIDHDLLCQRSIDGNQPFIIDTMSGKAKFYVHCYNQNETYNNPEVQFNPPTTDATPVNCNSGQGQNICHEGYCGMFEVSSITPDGKSQVSQKYQYCPNRMFNQLYIIKTNGSDLFNTALINDLNTLGPICVDKLNLKFLYKNGLSSYFMYVNCYVPNNTNSVQFPEIPNLMFYATTTTTTTSNPIITTTKLATPSRNCEFYLKYNLLGQLQNTSVQEHRCKSDYVTCAYVSLYIPGLVDGYFSGCPEETNHILSTIVSRRFDVFFEFKDIMSNKTGLIDHGLLCQRFMHGNQPYLINTITGVGEFFVQCYNQNEVYNEPEVKYPPSIDVTPVKCNNGQGRAICTEGYCGMLELSSITPNEYFQRSNQYQLCPNDIINQLYFVGTRLNNTFSKALRHATLGIAPVCINKQSSQVLSKNDLSSYFWYVNCYVPNDTVSVQFPEIPNLMLYVSTTTSLIPTITATTSDPITTTTKIAIPSCSFSIITVILFIIISFIFKS
uniref:Transmembrane protein n=1 Tax=Strongyloides papillosus TaxID=174720 RepID=A0A0N5BJE8_STREA